MNWKEFLRPTLGKAVMTAILIGISFGLPNIWDSPNIAFFLLWPTELGNRFLSALGTMAGAPTFILNVLYFYYLSCIVWDGIIPNIRDEIQGKITRPVSRKFLYVGIAFFVLSLAIYFSLPFLAKLLPFEPSPSNQWIAFLLVLIPFAIGVTLLRAYFWSKPLPKKNR